MASLAGCFEAKKQMKQPEAEPGKAPYQIQRRQNRSSRDFGGAYAM